MNRHQRRVRDRRRLPDGSLLSFVRLQVPLASGALGVDYPTEGRIRSIVDGRIVDRPISDDELHRLVN